MTTQDTFGDDLIFKGTPILSDASVPTPPPELMTEAGRKELTERSIKSFERWEWYEDEDCPNRRAYLAGASAGAYHLWEMMRERLVKEANA